MRKFKGLTKFLVFCSCAAAVSAAKGQIMINDADLSQAITPEVLEGFYDEESVRESLAGMMPADFIEVAILGNDPNEIEIEVELEGDVTEDEVQAALEELQSELTEYAQKFLGTRYVWGAKGPNAFDCSGFTGYVFRNFGYDIGPCSRVQATRGEKVDIKEARVGDLMFFSRPKGGKTVGHVGMVIDVNPETGELKFIHASSKKGVTIQNFPDNGHYNRRFLQVRRIIDDDKLVKS